MATNVIPLPPSDQQVLVVPGESIHISNLDVVSPEIADEVASVEERDRAQMVRDRTVLGFRAAALARRSRDVDSLTTAMERVTQRVQVDLKSLPDALARELGGPEGRVSAPIAQAAESAAKLIRQQVEQARQSIEQHVGPGDSMLGRKLAELARLLDPAVDGSAPKQIAQAAGELGADGSPLIAAINRTVEQHVKPLRELVDSLSHQVTADSAVADALQQTPAKGTPYEERVVAECVGWAKATGSKVEHVGPDNQQGDVRIEPVGFGESVGPIAIECRTTADRAGRIRVARDCDEAMEARRARAAIYLAESDAGLAKELGEWAEGETERGPWIATTHECLVLAIRYLITTQQLAAARAARQQVDEVALRHQLDRMRTALRGFRDIHTKATQARKALDAIDACVEKKRAEISAALTLCEEQLRPLDADSNSDESEAA